MGEFDCLKCNSKFAEIVVFLKLNSKVCKVSNQFGEQKIEIRLTVRSYLAVHIHPQVQIINSGGRAMFNCTINGHPIGKIEWIHNGKPIFENNIIRDPDKYVIPCSHHVGNLFLFVSIYLTTFVE